MRSQHVAFTERNAVLNKIHEALADVTFHSDQTEILEGILLKKLEESFDGASPESGSETPVIMAVPQASCTTANCGCIDDRYPVTVTSLERVQIGFFVSVCADLHIEVS